ncbi:hypothetical protein B0H13DRAFT_2109750 [Mycena leptocephala]|nr:hypothetical protein B0H13DRAFT_2109750 [Mycena leptocephala]
MFCFKKRTFLTAVALGSCAVGVMSLTITGIPTTVQSGSTITMTWTSVSTDPPLFDIDIDQNLNSLKQTDIYTIITNISTASGSITFTLPTLSVGTHFIAFSTTDGIVTLTSGSIEILAVASSSIPSSSGAGPTTSAPVSIPPASLNSSSVPATSSKSQTGSIQSQTAIGPQKSVL